MLGRYGAGVMPDKIPVSVLIVTRDAASHLPRCLAALSDFDEIIVIDSHSTDGTAAAARAAGAPVISYVWDGAYPKKRQWCLDHVPTRYNRVFFVDADEVVTPALTAEIRALDWRCAGYFVRGRYVFDGTALRFGLVNNKLALFDRACFSYPVVNDLDAPGMGEMEGHYQPLPLARHARVGQVRAALLHYSGDDGPGWQARHENYAAWEAWMMARHAYPPEIGWRRRVSKYLFRHLPWRPALAFLHSYVVKGGFMDGARGFKLARSRFRYYRMVNGALSTANTHPAPQSAAPTDRIAA